MDIDKQDKSLDKADEMPLASRIALEHRGDAERHCQAGDEPWGGRE